MKTKLNNIPIHITYLNAYSTISDVTIDEVAEQFKGFYNPVSISDNRLFEKYVMSNKYGINKYTSKLLKSFLGENNNLLDLIQNMTSFMIDVTEDSAFKNLTAPDKKPNPEKSLKKWKKRDKFRLKHNKHWNSYSKAIYDFKPQHSKTSMYSSNLSLIDDLKDLKDRLLQIETCNTLKPFEIKELNVKPELNVVEYSYNFHIHFIIKKFSESGKNSDVADSITKRTIYLFNSIINLIYPFFEVSNQNNKFHLTEKRNKIKGNLYHSVTSYALLFMTNSGRIAQTVMSNSKNLNVFAKGDYVTKNEAEKPFLIIGLKFILDDVLRNLVTDKTAEKKYKIKGKQYIKKEIIYRIDKQTARAERYNQIQELKYESMNEAKEILKYNESIKNHQDSYTKKLNKLAEDISIEKLDEKFNEKQTIKTAEIDYKIHFKDNKLKKNIPSVGIKYKVKGARTSTRLINDYNKTVIELKNDKVYYKLKITSLNWLKKSILDDVKSRKKIVNLKKLSIKFNELLNKLFKNKKFKNFSKMKLEILRTELFLEFNTSEKHINHLLKSFAKNKYDIKVSKEKLDKFRNEKIENTLSKSDYDHFMSEFIGITNNLDLEDLVGQISFALENKIDYKSINGIERLIRLENKIDYESINGYIKESNNLKELKSKEYKFFYILNRKIKTYKKVRKSWRKLKWFETFTLSDLIQY